MARDWRRRLMAVLAAANVVVGLLGFLAWLSWTPAVGEPTCTNTWDGPVAGGPWTTATNWSRDVVPEPADYACIPATVTGPVTVSSGVQMVKGVQSATPGGLRITGGGLHLTDVLQPSSILALGFTSGSLRLESNVSLTLTGTSTWVAGDLIGPGTTTVAPGARLELLRGIGRPQLLEGHTLANEGTVDWQAEDFCLGGGAVFDNRRTFVISANSGTMLVCGATPAPRMHNRERAVIERSGTGLVSIDVPFENDGSIDATAAVLVIADGNAGGGADTGSIDVAAGATVRLSGGTRSFAAPARTTGAGVVEITGGFITGDLSIEGRAEWVAGQMTGPGTTTVARTGSLDFVAGIGRPELVGGHVLLNQGTLRWVSEDVCVYDGAVLRNAGTFRIEAGEDHLFACVAGAAPRLHNTGTITRNGTGTAVAHLSIPLDNEGTIAGVTGILDIANGSSAGFSDTGVIDVAAGAIVRLSAGSRSFAGNARITGTGPVEFTGGVITGDLSIEGQLRWVSGQMTGAGTTTVARTGSLDFVAGIGRPELRGGHVLLNQGTLRWVSEDVCVYDGAVLRNAGTFKIDTGEDHLFACVAGAAPRLHNTATGTITRNGTGTAVAHLSIPLDNEGTIAGVTGILDIANGSSAGFSDTGVIDVAAGATVRLSAGSRRFAAPARITGAGPVELTGGIFTGDLSIEGQLRWVSGQMTGAGTTTVARGATLVFPGGVGRPDLLGGHVLLNRGTVDWTAEDVCVATGGILRNAGTFNVRTDGGHLFPCVAGSQPRFENLDTGVVVRNGPGATVATITVPVTNQGRIRLESAILRIDGDYLQPPGATLETVIRGSNPGTDFGQLHVSDTATLGGTLVVTNGPGFTPAPGQTFTVVTCGSACTGSFASVVGGYPVRYNPRDVTVGGDPTPAAVSVDPTSLAFGDQTVGTTSSSRTVTVTNTGGSPLNVGAVSVTGEFTKTSDTCSNQTLASGSSCTVGVTFAPTFAGARTGSLSIPSDAAGSPHSVALSGTGSTVAPPAAATVDPTSLAFGNQTVGTTSSARTVTVTNTGGSPLNVGAVAATGDFTKTTDTCSNQTLAPAGSCTVGVTFAPTTAGARSGGLSIPSNATGSPHAVALSGTGVAVLAPAAALDRSGMTFGTQPVGTTSAAQMLTVTNVGQAPLHVSSVAVAGPAASEFTRTGDTCTLATLAPGARCTVGIAFAPIAPGSRVASLQIMDNAPGSPRILHLSGTGIDAVQPGVSPSSMAFGNRVVGTVSDSQRITLTNSGSTALTVSGVVINGANPGDFTKTLDTCTASTVAPRGNCTVAVAFRPAALGPRSASLVITDTGAGSPRAVSLSGTGVVAPAPVTLPPVTAPPVTPPPVTVPPTTSPPAETFTATTPPATTPAPNTTTTTTPPTTTTTATTTTPATTTPTTTTPTTTPPATTAAVAAAEPTATPAETDTVSPAAEASQSGTTAGANDPVTPGSGSDPTTTTSPTTTTPPTTSPPPTTTPPSSPPSSTPTPSIATQPGAPPATADSAGPGLLAVSPTRTTSGPAGVGLDVGGSGYGQCHMVYFFFNGTRIGADRPNPAGEVSKGGLAVPGDTPPGRHTVTSSCEPSGKRVMHSSIFEVTGGAPHRSAVVTAMATPDQIDFSPEAIATSALVAAGLLFLIAFPSELFNSTLERHYDEIRRWFRRPPKNIETTARPHQGWLFAGFVLSGGVLYGMINPTFGANRASVALALGLTVALALITLAFDLPALAYSWRENGHKGVLVILPGTLLIAAACVALSRAVDFLPGYFYGLIAGMVFGAQLSTRIKGRLVAVSALLVLFVSVGAWLWMIPVSEAADRPGAGLHLLVLEATLGAIFYIGLDSLVISLLPLRFLQGHELRAWSRTAWTVIFGLSLSAFVHILFRPNTGYVADTTSTSARLVVGLFIAFGIFSVLFWGYFRFRRPRSDIDGLADRIRQEAGV